MLAAGRPLPGVGVVVEHAGHDVADGRVGLGGKVQALLVVVVGHVQAEKSFYNCIIL